MKKISIRDFLILARARYSKKRKTFGHMQKWEQKVSIIYEYDEWR